MKKALIGLVVLLIIVAGVIIGGSVIRKSTAEKASDMVYKIFSELNIYDWDYKSASLLGSTLTINELVIDDDIFIKKLKLSKIKEENDQITANISIKGLDATEDHSKYFRVDGIKVKDFVFAERRNGTPVFRSFGDFEIQNLRFREYGEGVNIGSINFNGKFKMPFDSFDLEDMLYWASNFDYSEQVYGLDELKYDFSMKNLSIMIDAWSKPFEVQSITSTSKIRGNSIIQDFKAEAKNLFTVSGDSLSTFKAEGKEVHVADMEFIDMNLSYVDHGLIEFIFKLFEEYAPNARETAADSLREYGGSIMEYVMEDGETFAKQLAEFILKPERIILSAKPSEPLPYLDMLDYMTKPGSMFGMLDMKITFNNNEAFPLVFTPAFIDEMNSYYDYNYGQDYDYNYDYDYYGQTIGGMVVRLVSYDADYGHCTFVSVYEEDGEPFDLYCEMPAIDFFEKNAGASNFYIEYSDDDYVTYYDVDDGEYSDWYEEYNYDNDYDFGYDYEEPVAGFHMNYLGNRDSEMEFPQFICMFRLADSDFTLEFYCDDYDVDFFESYENPFFVEFSDNGIVTGYDTDHSGDVYEDWDDRE